MGIGYKALSILKKLASDLVRLGQSQEFVQIGSFGYQTITISIDDLALLIGPDNVNETLVRVDIYSSELQKAKRPLSIPLGDLSKIFSTGTMLKKLKIDRVKGLELALKAGSFLFNTDSIYEKIQCKQTAMDIIPHYGTELILDLCVPVEKGLHNKFDIVLDGGTTEHCFNVPQVLSNAVNMVALNGFVFHILPLTWPNHGFYNFNPCLFYEFYLANGFSVVHCLQSFNYGDDPLIPLPPAAHFPLPPENVVLFFAARKIKQVDEIVYPIQGVYKPLL